MRYVRTVTFGDSLPASDNLLAFSRFAIFSKPASIMVKGAGPGEEFEVSAKSVECAFRLQYQVYLEFADGRRLGK